MAANSHIILTSHARPGGNGATPLRWAASDAAGRGPVVATPTDSARRNAIGAHGGAYSLYRALAVTSGRLDPLHVPDLTNTDPWFAVGPHPQWSAPGRIVSLDPWGHMVNQAFAPALAEGLDVRPTIAVTEARLKIPEVRQAMDEGRLRPDGAVLMDSGEVRVTKAAIDPVWHLPGIAGRFGVEESQLRHHLFEHTGGMFPELVTRPDLQVFVPPIGGQTVYIIGEPRDLADPDRPVACRVHDECNGSDVFGSDICTCRPYLMHGVEVCIETAQTGGVGVIVYSRKEGRSLGEVTKFLVYNARKRQDGGDTAATYFERTECVAGVQDARFQELMPDVLSWLGVTRIDRFVSMSDMKHDALIAQGIAVGQRVTLPDALVPDDAAVEIEAKKADGYYSDAPSPADPKKVRGREIT